MKSLSEVPDHFFDVIVMNDVIEHLTEPWDDIKKLKNKLKDMGYLSLLFPMFDMPKTYFMFSSKETGNTQTIVF